MGKSRNKTRIGFFLRPASIGVLGLLVLAGVLLNWFDWQPQSPLARRVLRELGYAALVCLLVTYAYWPRQWFLDRSWLRMSGWLNLHVFASYAALGLTLVHSLGRAGSPLTSWMMVCFWAVVVSGVVGHFGQRICYRLLSLIIGDKSGPKESDSKESDPKEYGPKGLLVELQKLKNGISSVPASSKSTPYERFVAEAQQYLNSDWKSWSWLFSAAAYEPVSENLYQQARHLSQVEKEQKEIKKLWAQVQQRRKMDIEYWFHRAARCWLIVHRIAAAGLLVLVVAHVISSIRFGGW